MTDHIPDAGQKVGHIIKAAKEAGGTTYTNRHHNGTACAFGPEALARFYAIAYRTGLEHAADEAIDIVARHGGSVEIEAAIRALKEQDAAIAAGKGDV